MLREVGSNIMVFYEYVLQRTGECFRISYFCSNCIFINLVTCSLYHAVGVPVLSQKY